MLRVSQLHQYYGGGHILRGVDLSARQDEVAYLLRHNGVGKTTLLKCLMRLIPARGDEVHRRDQNITHRKPHRRVQAEVAYVPQGRGIFPHPTVKENLLMGLSRFPTREVQRVPEEIYQLFPVLKTMKQRRGGNLSGGQQQQLAIGRTLASRPQLLILNGPAEGIRPSVIKEVGEVTRQLASRGDIAILLVEQFYDFAAGLAGHYLVMSRGVIVQQSKDSDMEGNDVHAVVTI